MEPFKGLQDFEKMMKEKQMGGMASAAGLDAADDDSGSDDGELQTFDFAKMNEQMSAKKAKKSAAPGGYSLDKLPKVPDQDKMSVEDLRQALVEAQLYENRLLCVSLVNDLIPRVSDQDRLDYLKRKLYFLEPFAEAEALRDQVIKQVYMEEPADLTWRLKYIQSLFDRSSIWTALTEFMRFQADVEAAQLDSEAEEEKRKHDMLAQKEANQLLANLEQMRFLARVKLESARKNLKEQPFN